MTAPSLTLPLDAPEATLSNAGGKGANLGVLARAGLPVPPGFIVPTAGYRAFVTANRLDEAIDEALDGLQPDDPAALEAASIRIRGRFGESLLPPELAAAIDQAYLRLGEPPVAVRSSATAEDLPEMSFAGQQDTFLNIQEREALAAAVRDCWSSLWTARAIGYRARNGIPRDGIALAVVVQKMVPSEASGVMFTANPLTGLRSETVIDATLGLGEALVGGHVEPDHFIVDAAAGRILERKLGAKAIAITGREGGGVESRPIDGAGRQSLPDEAILALVALGRRAAALYDFPQDIEWGWAGGRLYLLQSRPITSLYPIPPGFPAEPLDLFFSFASVQGVFTPYTPLGQDGIRLILSGGARLFGVQVAYDRQKAIVIAGERLWGVFTPIIRHPLGSRMIRKFLAAIDPGVLETVNSLWSDPRLGVGSGRFRLQTVRRMAGFFFPTARRLLGIQRAPEKQAALIRRRSAAEIARLQAVQASFPAAGPEKFRAAVAFFRELSGGFPFAVPQIALGAGAGMLSLFLLNRLSSRLTGSGNPALEITRGLPHNVTTEMDLILWETARIIQADEQALAYFRETDPEALAADFSDGRLPAPAQAAIAAFLDRYGMRGIGEIDIGRPRWREEPVHIMEILQSYLKIDSPDQAPDQVFKRGEVAAAAAAQALEKTARSVRFGRLKAALVRALTVRVRALAGLRESPKFHIIQMMGLIREGLLESGRELAAASRIARPEDLFFLFYAELEAFAAGEERDWPALIAERRATYDREMRRRQIPRLLLSDGRAFYEGIAAGEPVAGGLTGSPVSPGIVEGLVRVVRDPQRANLEPGEIMVCEGTDPAWTPLFLAAGGLIMEVGGLMTHGAIVAREYGIPAVVGVHQATSRLVTGQRIRLDGSTGQIFFADS